MSAFCWSLCGRERRRTGQRRGRKQRREIAIVGREPREPPAACGRDALEPRDVELRYHDRSLAVGHEAALGAWDRRALLGADREHADVEPFAAQLAREIDVGGERRRHR